MKSTQEQRYIYGCPPLSNTSLKASAVIAIANANFFIIFIFND